LASITGTPDGPGRVSISVCDIATGMTAHAGICEALIERQRTGRGRGISVAMFDTMARLDGGAADLSRLRRTPNAARRAQPPGHLPLWRLYLPRWRPDRAVGAERA